MTASPAALAALRATVRPVYAELERDPFTAALLRQVKRLRAHAPADVLRVRDGFTAGMLVAVPLMAVGGVIAVTAAPLFDVDRRNALAAAVATEDWRRAREAEDLYARTIGWTVLQTPPVAAQGTALLESAWAEQVLDNTIGFLRDYL